MHDLEDGAGQLSGIFEWRLGDRVQAFSVGALNFGAREGSEFRSILDASVAFGVELFLF